MNLTFSDYDLIIFDLDNTLYDESIYLFRGYCEVSKYLSDKYLNVPFDECEFFLQTTFQNEGRNFLFDKLFKKYSLVNELENCLNLMRTVAFEIKLPLFEISSILLKEAMSSTQVCILTNGNPLQQRNKINQIDWKFEIDDIDIVFATEYASKPSAKSYEEYLMPKYNLSFKKILMIGDHISDKEFSDVINSDFIYIDELITFYANK